MTLTELIRMARLYTRDTYSNVFQETDITAFLNQGILRMRQYKAFDGMTALATPTDVPKVLPESYHYILSLFAASRLFDMDERFSEGTEKRNEFEYYFTDLISEVQSGNITLLDGTGAAIDDTTTVIDFVTDTYFGSTVAEEE